LIMSISLIDQMVERFFCEDQNEKEILLWNMCPSKPGMGTTEDWQIRLVLDSVYGNMQYYGRKGAATDVTGWDWAVKEWQTDDDVSVRVMLQDFTGEEDMIRYERGLRTHDACMARSVFSLSDGVLIAQLHPGVQKSGRYRTSSTNSRSRVELALLAGVEWANAMGDDDTEDFVPGAVSNYSMLGFDIKDYISFDVGEKFEFCSHEFSPDGARYSNWLRGFFYLLSQNKIDQVLIDQFGLEMRYNQEEMRLVKMYLELSQ